MVKHPWRLVGGYVLLVVALLALPLWLLLRFAAGPLGSVIPSAIPSPRHGWFLAARRAQALEEERRESEEIALAQAGETFAAASAGPLHVLAHVAFEPEEPTFVEGGNLTLDAGASLEIHGPYRQRPTASVSLTIAGPPVSDRLSKLIIFGPAVLKGGTLWVNLGAGFRPEAGDRFRVIAFEARSGEFAAVNGLDLGNGLRFEPVYTADSLTLVTVSAPPTEQSRNP